MSNGLLLRMMKGAFTEVFEATAGFGDSGESFTVCCTSSM
jgi:hypothetical protein